MRRGKKKREEREEQGRKKKEGEGRRGVALRCDVHD